MQRNLTTFHKNLRIHRESRLMERLYYSGLLQRAVPIIFYVFVGMGIAKK